MKVLASIDEPDPEQLFLTYFPTLSLHRGGSPPVLAGGMNAVYVGPRWTRAIAEDFASIRSMPIPAVIDWEVEFIERLLARATIRPNVYVPRRKLWEPVLITPADLDHDIRGW